MREFELSKLCRDERCDLVEVHLAHKVTAKRIREPRSKNPAPAWVRPAPRALDNSIARATSKTYPRHFDAILKFVEGDYGACIDRTVHRRLKQLVQRGHILRIDLGRSLYAYLRPGSSMANDVDLIREQIYDAFEQAVPS